ncbi:MAG: PKD domain-containing protein [Anaerolineae bacterium]
MKHRFLFFLFVLGISSAFLLFFALSIASPKGVGAALAAPIDWPTAPDAAPEIGVWKWQMGGFARPGGKIVYGLAYWNDGDAVAADVIITDTLPVSTTYAGDTSGLPVTVDANGVITWYVGAIPVPGNDDNWGVFAVTLDVDAAMPTGEGALGSNCAAISTTTPGDGNPNNNLVCTDPVNVQDSDVGINVDKWPAPGDPNPGQEFVYIIRWCSDSGANFGPVWLTDTLPVSTTVVSWNTIEWPQRIWTEVITTGGQFVLYAPGLPGDWCQHINLRLRVDPAAPEEMQLSNHVVVETPDDAWPDNNERLNEDALTSNPRLDLTLDKSLSSGMLVPGGWINYFIWYGNQGNMEAPTAITETVPDGLSFDFAQWGGGQPNQNERLPDPTIVDDQLVWQMGNLPVNDNHWFHVQMNITDTLQPGDLITNCATVSINEGERTAENNSDCLTVRLNPSGPNLRVTKESWWNGTGQLGYRIHFYNVGSETVSNVWITDTLPANTTWNGWWNLNSGRSHTVTPSLTSDRLAWQFLALDPGDSGEIEFNANLDEPGVPMRWFTNTVEITLPSGDTDPTDNTDTNVAFSGGEVQWVDFDVYRTRVWGCAPQAPITVTTALAEMTFGDTCWNENNFPDTFDPGDVITVTAGAGLHPVVITIPDPFTGQISSISDMVWGQIDALDHEIVQVDLWGFPTQRVETDDQGHYSASYPDIPHGAQGDVGYWAEINYAWIGFHHRLDNLDLSLNVNYDHDWVEGNYEGGHTVWLTVTNDLGDIKATAELTTGVIPWWNDGQTGFSTNLNDPWRPQRPDIQPGDFVHGATEGGYTATVHIGQITGLLDVDADSITGTVDAAWLMPGPVDIECHTWGAPGGAPNKSDSVIPNGLDTYTCAWDPSSEWDIQPGQDLAVMYREPAGHNVFAVFRAPAPRMRVEKWLDGNNPAEGGNAVFYVQYRNEGDAPAENVVITDTLQGMTYITDTSGFAHTGSGDQVVLDLGTVQPGDWIHFYVFAEVTAMTGERVTNTVQIATSNPFDQGGEGEKRSEWSGDVQPNNTYLNVGKWAWTDDPVAGEDVVFGVRVCSNGSTASSEVVLTDTLHPSMTLQTWWGQQVGWVEVSRSAHELVVSRPSISGGCSEVYVRATVDADAEPGMPISNTATIYAANDLSSDDNTTWWWGNVNTPHSNLNINKNWGSGQLVPGGELRYWIGVHNNGNIPVGAFRITDTLPVSTTFQAAWHHDEYGQYAFAPVEVGAGYVVWEFTGLDNGYGDNFEVVLDVAPDALPGTVLVNTAEVTPLPGEDTYDDNISVWTETLFNHGPNLRVRKEGQWDNWGENTRRASYRLNVENVGDERVDMVTVTDIYPTGMRMDGGIGGGFWRWWDWRDNGDHFTMTLELLEPGWSVGFDFGLITDTEPLPFGLVFTNTAEVMLAEGDVNPADNTDTALLTTGPDLWVEKELVGGEFLPGEQITFSLRFGNNREGWQWWWGLQNNAVLTDTLPAGFEYVSAVQHWCGWTEWCEHNPEHWSANQAVWDLWPINAGEWNEIYITVRIPATATGLDTFINRAEIASSEPLNDVEVYTGNNAAEYRVAVDLPYFEVGKVYESTTVAGMPITYTLTVTNSGNSVGTGIILSDTIPAGLAWDSGGTFQLPWVWWSIDSLAPNGGVTTAMFEATLPCAVGTVVNNDYRVVDSDQGVVSAVGAPVSVQVLAPTLNVGFDQSAVTALVSTTLRFTDTSTTNGPDIIAWAWDFDDGHSASGADVTHTYTTDGVFTVRLTITDTCGYTATTTSVVTVNAPALVASFTQSTGLAEIGATVYFTDTSTTDLPPIVAWAWDFGDGSPLAFTQNANHAFDTENTFTVTLTITDTLGYSDSYRSTVRVTKNITSIFLPLVVRNY